MAKYGEVTVGKKKYKVMKDPIIGGETLGIKGWSLQLDLRGKKINDIGDIQGLSELTDLVSLDLADNNIKEIKGLDTLVNLRILMMAKNQITEIKGLDKLVNLGVLSLDDNQISEIKGLDKLVNLRELTLSKNKIEKITGLASMSKLVTLGVNKNPVHDWALQTFGKARAAGCVNGEAAVKYCQGLK